MPIRSVIVLALCACGPVSPQTTCALVVGGPREEIAVGVLFQSANDPLLDSQGRAILGYPTDARGRVTGPRGALRIPAMLPPKPTTRVQLSVVLSRGIFPSSTAFSVSTPGTTSDFSSSVTLRDATGAVHAVDVFLKCGAAGSYNWHAVVDGAEIVGGTAGTSAEITFGTLNFSYDGVLNAELQFGATIHFVNAPPMNVAFDFGTDPSGSLVMTRMGEISSNQSVSTDDAPAAPRTSLEIDADGVVTATYANADRLYARLAFQKTDFDSIATGPAGGSNEAVGCGLGQFPSRLGIALVAEAR